MPKKVYGRQTVDGLAALSRTYHESLPDISAVIMQEMRKQRNDEERAVVGEKFGLAKDAWRDFKPDGVLRLRHGHIHRAGLCGFEETMSNVLLDMQSGKLRPGSRFPPRTKFTKDYYCDKKTHSEVVRRLMGLGILRRPGGSSGGLYVSAKNSTQ